MQRKIFTIKLSNNNQIRINFTLKPKEMETQTAEEKIYFCDDLGYEEDFLKTLDSSVLTGWRVFLKKDCDKILLDNSQYPTYTIERAIRLNNTFSLVLTDEVGESLRASLEEVLIADDKGYRETEIYDFLYQRYIMSSTGELRSNGNQFSTANRQDDNFEEESSETDQEVVSDASNVSEDISINDKSDLSEEFDYHEMIANELQPLIRKIDTYGIESVVFKSTTTRLTPYQHSLAKLDSQLNRMSNQPENNNEWAKESDIRKIMLTCMEALIAKQIEREGRSNV
jgi:hypothetical protein